MSQIGAAAETSVHDGSTHVWLPMVRVQVESTIPYECKYCGTVTRYRYDLLSDKLVPVQNQSISKECNRVRVEGIRQRPEISQNGKHMDFSQGGLVDKVVVSKGGSVSMKF